MKRVSKAELLDAIENQEWGTSPRALAHWFNVPMRYIYQMLNAHPELKDARDKKIMEKKVKRASGRQDT